MSKQKLIRNAYTSQKNKRPVFSLKNLFPVDAFQSNFVSLASEKLIASRPQTMVCDRLKNKIYQQAANQKRQNRCLQINFKTDSKFLKNKCQQLKRSSSYHQSSAVEVKQIVSMQQKIKMKKALGKINLLAQNQFQAEQQQQIQAIFNFLNCLSQNQHFYNNAFKYLKNQIFMQRQNLTEEQSNLLKILIQSTSNKNIIQLVHGRNSQKSTFKKIVNEIIKQYIAIQKKINKESMKSSVQLKQLNLLLQEKQQTISKLIKKVKHLQKHPSENRYSYILQLQIYNYKSINVQILSGSAIKTTQSRKLIICIDKRTSSKAQLTLYQLEQKNTVLTKIKICLQKL